MDTVSQWQAQAALQVLKQRVPAAAEQVEEVLTRLFVALAEGDTCIRLNADEWASLQDAQPIVGSSAQASTPLVQFAGQLALGRMWQLEAEIAAHLRRLSQVILPEHDLSALLRDLFSQPGSQEQQQAAAIAAVNQLTVITGGPGTGKTTTVAKLLCLLSHQSVHTPRIALAAPTGKAAARMTESLRTSLQTLLQQDSLALSAATVEVLLALEGKTLHRLLGMKPPQLLPMFHAGNVLPFDVVIVDETSMLDSAMLRHLLAAIGNDTRVILLGDANQLPPVGTGELLSLLPEQTVLQTAQAEVLAHWLPNMALPSVPTPAALAAQTAHLTISHRFDANSGIGQLAHSVLHQQTETLATVWQRFEGEIVLQDACERPREMAQSLWQKSQLYWQTVQQGDPLAVFQAWTQRMLLTVRRRDAEAVNAALRDILAAQGLLDAAQGSWYHGQAVMVVRNDAEMGLFNGDVGVVLHDASGRLQAYFPVHDGMRAVPLSRLPEHEDAFAMTVHKSQGSEFAEVWLLPPLGTLDAAEDYNRALLYTAITRAKQRFVYWGNIAGLQDACLRHRRRLTVLGYLLQQEPAHD